MIERFPVAPNVIGLRFARAPVNALTMDLLRALDDALTDISSAGAAHVVVLSGGGGIFCAGADLKDASDFVLNGAQTQPFCPSIILDSLHRVAASPLVTIAAIEGACIGAGLELALCCDIRIAASDASFRCAAVNIGLTASAWRLPRIIGLGRAKALLLSGETFDVATAERWGLVTEIFEPGQALEAGARLGKQIASRAPLSVMTARKLADLSFDQVTDNCRAIEAAQNAYLVSSRDHAEALAAFMAGREPNFRGE